MSEFDAGYDKGRTDTTISIVKIINQGLVTLTMVFAIISCFVPFTAELKVLFYFLTGEFAVLTSITYSYQAGYCKDRINFFLIVLYLMIASISFAKAIMLS